MDEKASLLSPSHQEFGYSCEAPPSYTFHQQGPYPTPYPASYSGGGQNPSVYGRHYGQYQQYAAIAHQVPMPYQVTMPYQVPMPHLVPMLPHPQAGNPAAVVQLQGIKDYYKFSLFLTIVWLLLCVPYLLCCTIPALFLSKSAQESVVNGDVDTARSQARYALYCNIASLVGAVLAYLGLVISITVYAVYG